MALTITPKIFKAFPEIAAGMTLRGSRALPFGFNLSSYIGDDPDRVAANRRKVAELFGFAPEQLAVQKQVHGDRIVVVKPGYQPGESDALATDQVGWLLAISVADCVPVLFYDPEKQAIAGVHSGWRGTAAHIAPKAVQYMAEAFGSRLQDLRVWVGPSSGKCCYEVGSDVAMQFDEEHSYPIANNKFLFDNKGAVLAGLLEAGVAANHIEVDIRCTICDERFHSYRRDGERSGRMYAVIGMVGDGDSK